MRSPQNSVRRSFPGKLHDYVGPQTMLMPISAIISCSWEVTLTEYREHPQSNLMPEILYPVKVLCEITDWHLKNKAGIDVQQDERASKTGGFPGKPPFEHWLGHEPERRLA